MKVSNRGGISSYVHTGSVSPTRGSEAARKTRASSGVPKASEGADVTSVMGIPEAELTPKVRQAIAVLMAEVQDLREEIERLKKRAEFLEQLADQDSLAPILNRRAFVRELSRHTSFAERYGHAGSVLYFDINGMKDVNDRLGHAAGDLALKHVADILVKQVRASDIVGRLGGDEFGVILAQTSDEAADIKAQQLAEAIAGEVLSYEGREFQVGVAYGVYTLAAGDQVEEALDAADKAMYAQKRHTRSEG
ncbi:MAG: GGDEF domain-containing protein [Kiloniellales bacterium]|nr:GGDEF domain-containing protein [Kiloniellales bacterium]